MKVEQIYTGCLAQGAYYIVSQGEAAIVDLLREVSPYLDKLREDNSKLKYIFETHFHADFVSGHLNLREKTGANIVYGPTANPEFQAIIAKDEEIFCIGNVKIKVLHTPGHTLESSCYLLFDENGKEKMLFSGDTLFIGDVGRPDLAQNGKDLTREYLAGMMYDSLNSKIMPLSDDIIVYPAHGAGSVCGKNMQKETSDTLGNQKKTNYALNQPNKESFIKEVISGINPPPEYFSMNVDMNKKGYESFDKVLNRGLNSLSAQAFEHLAEFSKAVILDTRSAEDFHKCFIPQSINIGLKGSFAPWVGAIVMDVNQKILLVTDTGFEQEAITRLSRVGFDNVLGYLEGGINTWIKSGNDTDKINRISAENFSNMYNVNAKIIDVRKESEYELNHIKNSKNYPLSSINKWINDMNPKEYFYLHCEGGYRSMIASSILYARGFRNFSEIRGGFNSIKLTNIPLQN